MCSACSGNYENPDRTSTEEELDEAVQIQDFPTMNPNLRIKTQHVCPPIPNRSMDWMAWDDNTYDASFAGSDESGDHWESSPLGWGATEEEAIADLLEQLGIQI